MRKFEEREPIDHNDFSLSYAMGILATALIAIISVFYIILYGLF